MFIGAVGVVRVGAAPSGQNLIARAHTFVTARATAKFSGTTTVKGGTERSPTAPAQTALAHIKGELHSPGRAHALIADDNSVAELVLVGRAVYVRAADTAANLARDAYTRADTQVSRLMRVRAEQAASLDVAAILAAATNGKTIQRKGETSTIEADVTPAALFGPKLSRHVKWATLRTVIADDGEVHRMQLLTRGEASILSRVVFTGWGAGANTIAAPAATQLDNSPPVAQAELASFTAALLFMPKTLPPGWELVRGGVLAAGDTEEGCAQAELAYEDQRRGDVGFLYLYEFPNSCAAPPSGETKPFTAGNYKGFGSQDGGPYVQIVVGRTTVQAVSDLPLDQLARTLSELVPLALRSA